MRIPISPCVAKSILAIVITIIVIGIVIVFWIKRDNTSNTHDIFGSDSVINGNDLRQIQDEYTFYKSKDFRTYNPCVFEYRDEIWKVYRLCNFTGCPNTKNKWDPNFRTRTISYTIIESPHGKLFRVVHPNVSGSKCEQGCEDARTIVNGDQLYLLCNSTSRLQCGRDMNIMEIPMRAFEIEHESRSLVQDIKTVRTSKLHFDGIEERDQKNWMPFIHNGHLHFVYSVNPHIILGYESDGRCHVVSETSNPKMPNNLRGGSQVIPVTKWNHIDELKKYDSEDLYLGVIHSREGFTEYTTYIYAFERKYPFKVKYLSSGFVFGGLNSHSKRIQFASGITRVMVGGDWHFLIVYGENDCSGKECLLREEDVLRSLKKV